MRHDGRQPDQLRPLHITRGFTQAAPGSVLLRAGRTIVLCTASVEPGVPTWREGSGQGWLTAEYDMIPGSTERRRARERMRIDGRTQEIQRLIGRSLRAAVSTRAMGERTIYLDCEVLQADGGTRTAAVTGAYVALADAVRFGEAQGWWPADVLTCAVAAVSTGIVQGRAVVDLDYREDVAAEVDCNLVMTSAGAWVEVQATAERGAFGDAQMSELMSLGRRAIESLFTLQRQALGEAT
jgi:ribonuclease PH